MFFESTEGNKEHFRNSMKSFSFVGSVESSKSLYNRALILQAQFPDHLTIQGQTSSEDVIHLKCALATKGNEFYVGDGGTTLRFLAIYLSKKPGHWIIRGSERLFSRPMQPLIDLLKQLGVVVQLDQQTLRIESRGWKWTDVLDLDLSKSSQFASGFLLCSWNLDKTIELRFSQIRVSDGYLEMTLKLMTSMGFQYDIKQQSLVIPPHQKPMAQKIEIEQDLSSAFVVASLAAARGSCELFPFDIKSLQPDVAFVEIFKKIGIPVEIRNSKLKIHRSQTWNPIRVSLKNSPDLFPVLCVLLSKCDGESEIYDTPQLVYKESNRLQKTSELLNLMRVQHQVVHNGIRIEGKKFHHHESIQYDPDHDHRLAFAAAVAKAMGYRMRILNPEVVNKSFPGFWDLITGGAGI